ncbi:MAG TPA: YceD family protein [Candidatus Saccharimonadales bacterium]|nr:YceD family protein [Candidatus Saccharimonadales bacterium]
MALTFNLRHLEEKNLRLEGQLTPEELQLTELDELVHANRPMAYDLEVQKLDHAVLVRGMLKLELDCECARCLRPFRQTLQLKDWACHLALEGEESVQAVNDCVDLTPYIREDMVLAFPQHPLCRPECGGLASPQQRPERPGSAGTAGPASTAWAALDKLKL